MGYDSGAKSGMISTFIYTLQKDMETFEKQQIQKRISDTMQKHTKAWLTKTETNVCVKEMMECPSYDCHQFKDKRDRENCITDQKMSAFGACVNRIKASSQID